MQETAYVQQPKIEQYKTSPHQYSASICHTGQAFSAETSQEKLKSHYLALEN